MRKKPALNALIVPLLATTVTMAKPASEEDTEWARSVGDAMTFEQEGSGGIFSPEGGDASKITEETTGIQPESRQEEDLLQRSEDSYGKEGKLESIGQNTSDEWEANSPDTSSGTAFDVVTGSMNSRDGTRLMESHGCTIRRTSASEMDYDPTAAPGQQITGDGYVVDEKTCQEEYTGPLNSECRIVGDKTECIEQDNTKIVTGEPMAYEVLEGQYRPNYGGDIHALPACNGSGRPKDQTQLIKNGQFTSPNVADGQWKQFSSSSIPGWSGTLIELWGTGHKGVSSQRADQHAELNSEHNSPYRMYQNVRTAPGVKYVFSFHHRSTKGRTEKIRAFADGNNRVLSEISKSSPGQWRKRRYTFIADDTSTKVGVKSVYPRGGKFGNLIDNFQLNPEYCKRTPEIKVTAHKGREELSPLFENDNQSDVCWKAGTESVCERQVEQTDAYLDSVVEGAWDEDAIEEEFLKMAGGCSTEEVTKTSDATLEYTEEGLCSIPQDIEIEGCSINRNIELDGDGNIVADKWEGSDRCKNVISKVEDYRDTCDFNIDYNEPGIRTIDGHDVMTCDYAKNQADTNGLFDGGLQVSGLIPDAHAADSGCPDSHPVKVTNQIASDFPHIGYNDVGKCVKEENESNDLIGEFTGYGAAGLSVSFADNFLTKSENIRTAGVYPVKVSSNGRSGYAFNVGSRTNNKGIKYNWGEVRVGGETVITLSDYWFDTSEEVEALSKGEKISFYLNGRYDFYWSDGDLVTSWYNTTDNKTYKSYIRIYGEGGCPEGYGDGESNKYDCLSSEMKGGCAIYKNLKDHGYPGNKITERIEVSQISCTPESLRTDEEICNDDGECIEPGQSIGPILQEDTCREYRQRGCTRTSNECVNEMQHPLGDTHCVEREQRYECEVVEEHSNEVTVEEYDCGGEGEFYCMDGNCVEDPKGDEGGRFGEVAARITAAEGIASHTECADETDPSTCKVFGGEAVACREGSGPLSDLWNCCDVAASEGSGSMTSEDWARMTINASAIAAGVQFDEMPFESDIASQAASGAVMAGMAKVAWDMAGQFMELLISCKDEEFQLAHAKQVNQATYIGRRCGESISVGFDDICVRRDYHYCKFDSLMSKVVMEQSMGQLGRTMGTAANPNCKGMTIDEVADLNWDNINLDEWEAELRKADVLNPPALDGSNTDSSLPAANPGEAPAWE